MSVRLFPGFTSSSLPPGGTVGQGLYKNSSNNFDVSWKTFAVAQFEGNYTGVTSSAPLMFGSGLVITSAITGRIFASLVMTAQNTGTTGFAQGQLRYGTGTPPVQGAALAGLPISTYTTATPPATSAYVTLAMNCWIQTLLGNPTWFDVAVSAASGSINFQNAQLTLIEF